MSSEKHPVRDVIEEIIGDQAINANQVQTLEKFVKADWIVDSDEAKLLFRINKALGSNHDDCPEWTEFYVATISRLVVMDMNSPGEIDESEGDWLVEMLDEYAINNLSEKKLILEIKKCTTSIKGKLSERI